MILLSVPGGVAVSTSNDNEILHFYLFEQKVNDRREVMYVGSDCSSNPTDAPLKVQRDLFPELSPLAHAV